MDARHSGAVVRVADRRHARSRAAAGRSTRRSRRESTGSTASAQAGPGLAPAVTPSAIYAAANDGTLTRSIRRPAARLAHQRRAHAVGGSGRRAMRSSSSAPTRATCSRSTPTARRCGRRESRARSSRRRGWPTRSSSCSPATAASTALAAADGKTMGLPAHQSAADGSQLRGRHRQRAAACSPARPAARCSRSIAARASSAGTAPSRRRRARPSSSASPTSRACRSSTRSRCAPSPTRAASRASTSCAARCYWSRDVSSLSGIAADAQRLYVADDKGARAGARPQQRRLGLEAGRAREAAHRRAAADRRSTSASSTSKATCICCRAATARMSAALATDGSRATTQPAQVAGGMRVADREKGTVYSVTAQ